MTTDNFLVSAVEEIGLTTGELQLPQSKEFLRWQAIWVALMEQPWKTLAVVPVGRATDATDVARHLVEAAHAMRQQVFHLSDLGTGAETQGRCVMSVASPLQFPVAALTARNADAVLLVLALGEDTIDQARRVRDMIGPARIRGCVAANVARGGR